MKEFRGGIIRLFEQGKSGYQTAKDMKLPYTTVRDTIRRYRETGNYIDEYREFLRKKVLPWARRTYGWRNGQWQTQWVFNKTALHHTEQKKLEICPKRNNGEWPPNLPDLCVEDFSLWSILENEACSKPHQSIEALKKSLVKAWNAIPQEVIDRAVDDFPKRLKKCIDAQGGHFENN
uniref:Transposase n=1 Tax=Acrobeloides nanus TaxID=290746 RepID=A0A914DFJ6_9BILA